MLFLTLTTYLTSKAGKHVIPLLNKKSALLCVYKSGVPCILASATAMSAAPSSGPSSIFPSRAPSSFPSAHSSVQPSSLPSSLLPTTSLPQSSIAPSAAPVMDPHIYLYIYHRASKLVNVLRNTI